MIAQHSNTAQWRAQFRANEMAVLFFTGMSQTELYDFASDMAAKWLTKVVADVLDFAGVTEADAANMWLQNDELLKWWWLQWRRFDHYIVIPMLHKVVEAERENVYRQLHQGILDGQHPQYNALLKSFWFTLKNADCENQNSTRPTENESAAPAAR
ncbi:MAG: hypothetical protein EBZ77_06875 [Chitinophagia bacterium]|nr:hypothetical protein [Chitinophagia bacterium]